jgi:hypothetical protein
MLKIYSDYPKFSPYECKGSHYLLFLQPEAVKTIFPVLNCCVCLLRGLSNTNSSYPELSKYTESLKLHVMPPNVF